MANTEQTWKPATEWEKSSKGETEKGVDALKKRIIERANEIVHEIFPRKILKMNEIYQNFPLLNLTLDQVGETINVLTSGKVEAPEAPNKKRKVGGTSDNSTTDSDHPLVPSNKVILQLLDVLKKELLELIEMINTVKLWIQLNIPRIEDGNNFGVSIQEETVNELSRAEDSGFAVLESMTKYYVTRAKLVSKVIKYPQVQDYRQSITEIDEKEFINLRMCCMDLRNNYALLHDMILKNLEKIKTPLEQLCKNVRVFDLEFPDGLSGEVCDLIRRLVTKQQRLSFEQIMQHPWWKKHESSSVVIGGDQPLLRTEPTLPQ